MACKTRNNLGMAERAVAGPCQSDAPSIDSQTLPPLKGTGDGAPPEGFEAPDRLLSVGCLGLGVGDVNVSGRCCQVKVAAADAASSSCRQRQALTALARNQPCRKNVPSGLARAESPNIKIASVRRRSGCARLSGWPSSDGVWSCRTVHVCEYMVDRLGLGEVVTTTRLGFDEAVAIDVDAIWTI